MNFKKFYVPTRVKDKTVRPISDELINNKIIEKKYVNDVYDSIARHFSHTRYKPWPNVEQFINRFPVGSVIIDTGCGNGKYLQCGSFMMGTDNSRPLLEEAQQRLINKNDVYQADCRDLAMRSGCADCAISIAVIHHLSSRQERIAAVSELIRVVKDGGYVLIYVWAAEQEKGSLGSRDFTSQDVLVPWHLQKAHLLNERDDLGDDDSIEFLRYYHVFKKEEILEVCQTAATQFGALVDKIEFDSNNWAVTLKK
eukprot:GHVL01004728.1.p1 GENE.GHVL01004728.1~~GHVL01004728.1.p1  ORF type:complete len:254 (+),score=45.99 GHVL01004728.1:26-787(+)